MFRLKNWRLNVSAQQVSPLTFSKPLLYVLDYDQSLNDLPQKLWRKALRGETDVFISRAEIDLRKAIQSLAYVGNASISSIPDLTALALPGKAVSLFWTIHILLQQTYPKPDLDNPIHHRNHDARLLFQQLAKLDLHSWYIHSVDQAPPDTPPEGIEFPPGHPIAGQMYRQHPLKEKHHCYYPVTQYFSLLFEEREQALLSLLGDLGATKIVIEALHNESSSAESHKQIFEYGNRGQTVTSSIDVEQYPWLAYEPIWQSVVNERLKRGMLSTQFEFDLDVMGLLRTQVQTATQLIPELDSIMLPANYEETLLMQVLQPRKVQVEFG
ncbi:MAG: hypothetical protein QNJ46_30715 [Leptolyngbyaceae cyanobacterium MO_188.B28]|nr:hypothetical protein [Leptolyngbyaceae cyanobacterium MO_188.B28]